MLRLKKSFPGFLAAFFISCTLQAQYVIERIDINPGPADSRPQSYVGIDSLVYFQADDGTYGYELWISDGTAAGTKRVTDIKPGPGSSNPEFFTKYKGKVYFAADDGTNGKELWVTDGTALGTQMLKNINPGAGSSNPGLFYVAKNLLFFKADDGTHGRELWVTDGTANGTILLKDIRSGGQHSDAAVVAEVNGTILVNAYDGTARNAIWTTDGTTAGTQIFKLVGSNSNGWATLTDGVMYNGKYYFRAQAGTPFGYSLWQTDGTANGTSYVMTFDPGGSGEGIKTNMVVLQNKLFFGADSSGALNSRDIEPWVSDGTANGTHRLKKIHPSVVPNSLNGGYIDQRIVTLKDSLVFFTATDSVHGLELWVSDGTANGTVLIQDINKQSDQGSNPDRFTAYAGKLFFSASDTFYPNPKGPEFYVTDGTTAGTKKVLGHSQGTNGMGSIIDILAVANGSLFLRGSFDTTGFELWVITDTAYNNKDTTHNPGAVKTVTANTGLKIAPNPASGNILLSFDKIQSNGIVTITDLSGRVVKKITLDKPTETLNISLHNIPVGTYIVSLKNTEGIVAEKILIE
ncbi:MAG: T9SS type A sorting domain-containing protein [Chitinophagales bacterium]|nr:T9SS type A sorting domain-containing protein [Chitinophagales bacterium]